MSTSTLPLPTPPSPPHNRQPSSHLSLSGPPPNTLDEPPMALQTPSIRSRLSRLCQDGHLHVARQVFDTLPRPSTVLWNTIMIGFICNSLPCEALWFYSRMRSATFIKCDSYTYSSVLKACADTQLLRIGKAVHCHVIRSNINASRIVYNSLLNMYSTCLASTVVSQFSDVDLVRRVFDTMKKRDVVSWNTIISWFVKTERIAEAVVHFRLMLRMGIKPTAVSFVNVLPAVSGICDYELGNVLYGMLIKFGGGYVDDLFAISSAIVMYSEMGYVDLARKIFDGCLDRNVEVWNSMIGGYMQNNCFMEALNLFIDALTSEHMMLDDVSYISALNTVSQLQQFCMGKQLHAHVLKNPKALSVTVLNAVIVMYSRCNCIRDSFKVFDGMIEKDVVSWNTMITALVQNGLDEEGLMLVYEMQKQGFKIDAVTVTALLSSAANIRSVAIGKQTHAYVVRHGIEFQGMDSYLIDMYAKSGLIKKSQILFGEGNDLTRDQATWNAMISGNVQNGLIEEAFVVLRQMLESNMFPNAVTIASILPACSQKGSMGLGKQLHCFAIRHSLGCNVFVGSALVDMYSKLGAIASAEKVFSAAGTESGVTYTNMILGYGQHGMGTKALSLFSEMQRAGLRPDAITFIAILSACSYVGLVDEGLRIFHSMEEKYGIKPSIEHYACVIDMLGRDCCLEEAVEMAEKLGDEGCAIQAWGSILTACRTHRRHELAKIVAKKLLHMESRQSKNGYRVLLSHIYADEGNWETADKVRKDMRERGQRKEVGHSWIEVSGHISYFVSKDLKHQQVEDIYGMLETLVADREYVDDSPLLTDG
uniref:Uncharacterized protein n=1 Tax=Opuntia streptacantha TaxID=393608 RepID=A0A7C9EGV2_OPUST